MTNAPIDKSKLAKNDQEHLDLLSSDADWIIRTPDDLRQLRATNEGPLAKLPEEEFQAFVDGLEFKADGVGGGSYRELMSSLTMSEIFEIFERFGMDREYALYNHEYTCVNGSLEFSFWRFCSSTCHAVVVEPAPE